MRVLAVLLMLALAGCTAPADDHDHGDHAHGDMDGSMDTMPAGDLTIEILSPGNQAAEGPTEVRLRVTLDDAPVTDATLAVTAWMNEHDHGCGCDEPAPEHQGEGFYLGSTEFIMPGDWEIRVSGTAGDEQGSAVKAVTVA